MVPEDGVAGFQHPWFAPWDVGLSKACNVNVVRCHVACKKVEFAEVVEGVQPKQVLEDDT